MGTTGKGLFWVLDAAKDILRLKIPTVHNASIWTPYQRPHFGRLHES
jgi:hypothetical protein